MSELKLRPPRKLHLSHKVVHRYCSCATSPPHRHTRCQCATGWKVAPFYKRKRNPCHARRAGNPFPAVKTPRFARYKQNSGRGEGLIYNIPEALFQMRRSSLSGCEFCRKNDEFAKALWPKASVGG